MVETKISSRKTGAPRFVPSADGWKPKLTEFKLTPEQLERYKQGEKIENILKGDKPVGLTKERYLGLKSQGTSDMKIAKEFGFKHIGELTQWKKENFSPEEIEQLRINTLQAKRSGTLNKSFLSSSNTSESKTTKNDLEGENKQKSDESEQQIKDSPSYEIKTINVDYKSQYEALSKLHEQVIFDAEGIEEDLKHEIELLKREVIDAHKLVTEKDERLSDSLQEHLRKDELISKLQTQLERSVELYETAMLDKDSLNKENTILVNNMQTLICQRDRLQERCDRYQSEFLDLEEEVNGLRRFAMVKLKKDVFSA